MKNPFKGLGDKLKNLKDKFQASRKHESAKAIVDGVGDSGIISGIAMIGTAAFLPAAPMTVLIAGGAFIAAGAGAKYLASKMKPGVYDVTNPPEDKSVPEDGGTAPVSKTKTPGPDFGVASEKPQASDKKQKPAPKPASAPHP